MILRDRVGHRMAVCWKIAESLWGSGFQLFLFLRVPRTLHSKGFSVLMLFFGGGYDTLRGVPRKRTLKTKYIDGFKMRRLQRIIIPIRD